MSRPSRSATPMPRSRAIQRPKFVGCARGARRFSRGDHVPQGYPCLTQRRAPLAKGLFSLANDRGSHVALYRERRRHTREGGATTMEKILVPLDGSDLAEAALETA